SLKRGGKAQPKAIEEEAKPAEEAAPRELQEPKEPKEEAPKETAVEPPVVEKPAEQTAAEDTPDETIDKPAAAAQETPVSKVEAKPEVAKPDPKPEPAKPAGEVIRARAQRLTGPNVVGRIDLPKFQPKEKPVASSSAAGGTSHDQKRKRNRKDKPTQRPGTHAAGQQGGGKGRPDFRGKPRHGAENREEPSEKEIQDQIKATLARLSGAGKSSKFAQRAKLRRQKRDDIAHSA